MIVKGREVKVNMQRRHLELIASVINNIEDGATKGQMAIMFADALKRERVNDNFNVARFVEACIKDK